ncbi:MAG: uracil-xanthine permease family protein, partial [Shewanella sp.]
LALFISIASLLTTILVAVFAKGILKLMPILSGITVGYLLSLYFGIVDFSAVVAAPWFAIPHFVAPEFHWQAIMFMIPVAIAPAVEHIGDILAISNVAQKDYMKKPGLHRTLMGDGIATIAAASFGGPPNTTYSEVTGAISLTRNFNPVVMTWTAITAIVLAFVGKLGAMMQTIPVPVMGGIMCLLFGSIATVGLNSLIKNQVDLNIPRNLCIVGVTLVFGIGGMAFGIGEFSLSGISLCGIVAILMNLLLPAHFTVDHKPQ